MAELLLIARRWILSREGPALARAACLALCAGLALFLLFGRKPWEFEPQGASRPKLADIVRIWSWWAAAGNLAILGLLGILSGWWARAPRRIPGGLAPAAKGPRWFWPAVLGAALFLGLTAWPRMGQSAWHDEANRIKNTTVGNYRADDAGGYRWKAAPWRDTFFESTMPNHHLQTVLSRVCNDLWLRFQPPGTFPLNEAALRLPSFVAGLAAVILLAVLLRALGFAGPAILASWLLAVHPWMLRYAAEARGYALAMALIPAVLICLLRALETGRARWWIGFAAAEFALVYSYLTTVWVLVVLNAAFPLVALALRRRGLDLLRTLGAWLAANVFAGALFLQMTAPAIPQLAAYFSSEKARGFGWTLDGFWMQNTLSHFLVSLPWTYTRDPASSRLELQPWALAHPILFVAIVFLTVGFLFLGLRGLLTRGPFQALAAATFLLPAPLVLIQSKLSGTMLFEWYLIFALPGLCALVAIGLGELLPTRPAWVAPPVFAGAAGAMVIAFGLWTQPQRLFLMGCSLQPYREGVLLTRPALDPNHPGQERILTAAFHAGPLFYDPRIVRTRTVAELRSLMRRADKEGKELFLNLAYPATAAVAHPAERRLVYESGAFEWVSALPGLFPDMDIHVLRYLPGSEARLDSWGAYCEVPASHEG